MYNYDFKTKTLKHIFDNLRYVVNNSSLQIDCEPQECSVIAMFPNKALFVAMPIEKLGSVTIGGFNNDSTGFFVIKGYKIYFSIHEDVLYLRKSS